MENKKIDFFHLLPPAKHYAIFIFSFCLHVSQIGKKEEKKQDSCCITKPSATGAVHQPLG
jgi:hypothetical protein